MPLFYFFMVNFVNVEIITFGIHVDIMLFKLMSSIWCNLLFSYLINNEGCMIWIVKTDQDGYYYYWAAYIYICFSSDV